MNLKLIQIFDLSFTKRINLFQYDDSDDDDDEPSRRRRRLAAERAADGRLDVDDEDAGMVSFNISQLQRMSEIRTFGLGNWTKNVSVFSTFRFQTSGL